jgi:hypothetical protein
METTGGFAPVPQPPRIVLKRKPQKLQRDPITAAQIARQAYISEGLSAVMAVIQTKDRSAGEWVSWYNWLTLLASAAYDTQPGSPEREKVLVDALKDRPDQELARKFAALRSRGEPSVSGYCKLSTGNWSLASAYRRPRPATQAQVAPLWAAHQSCRLSRRRVAARQDFGCPARRIGIEGCRRQPS